MQPGLLVIIWILSYVHQHKRIYIGVYLGGGVTGGMYAYLRQIYPTRIFLHILRRLRHRGHSWSCNDTTSRVYAVRAIPVSPRVPSPVPDVCVLLTVGPGEW